MCVISISETIRPTPEQVEKMFESNPSGAGIAWREIDGNGPIVRWEKGLELEQIQKLCAEAPLPYVAHFRIPSCGGDSGALCHPFPVNKESSNALSGKTKDYVLFHNGHWGEWKRVMLDTALKTGKRLPVGKWSDSRAMAWAVAHYGIGFLDLIEEKVIVFGPEDYEVFPGTGWNKVVEGLWTSNSFWERSYSHAGSYSGGYGRGDFDRSHLPHHYGCDRHKQDDQKKVKGFLEGGKDTAETGARNDANKQATGASGGGLQETPFERALRLFKENKISKKALKRAMRKWDQEKRTRNPMIMTAETRH